MEKLKEHPDIIAFVETIAKEEGIKENVITKVETNQKGEGFLGQIFMITIKDKKDETKLDLVIKAAFDNEKVREIVPIRNSFLNEICFYTEVYPMFKHFEQECGISKGYNFVPKCYKVLTDNKKELLCLENLKVSNFELFDKTQVLDDDHFSFIFKIYGRFHAYSFALQDQKPEEYAKITNKLHDIYSDFLKSPNGGTRTYFKHMGELVEKLLKPGEDDEIIAKYGKYSGDGIVDIYEALIAEKFDYSVICHGDCWSNNMMFKYEYSENTKKLVDMRLLDLQIVRVASPVFDLSYCFYSGASKEVLDNLEKYLQLYYESFSSFLRELGGDPEKLFPYAVLKEHWKKYSKFGLILSLPVMRMKLTKKEDILDFSDDVDEIEKTIDMKFDEEEFGKRIRRLLYHMSKVGAL